MSLSRRVLAVAPLALVLQACVFIGNDKYDEKLATIDEDSDGSFFVAEAAADADCDDEDATRSTLIVEDKCAEALGRPVEPGDACVALAYNGIDDDCDKHDWVDIDGDGVPSMLLSEYEAAFPDALFAWPDDRIPPVTDEAHRDCDDFRADVFPENPSDTFYDGVDSDCAGNDDFDQDGDGHARIADGEAGDDCDDQDANAFPGNTAEDVWYDGIDTDCAFNNDFDQDGDTYMPDQAVVDAKTIEVAAKFATYISKPGYEDLPALFGDCLDAEPPSSPKPPPGIDPAEVFPGAPDDFYDGIDSDCEGNNDFDADVDAFMTDGYESDFDDYLAFWGYDFPNDTNDCNDDDDTVHPGQFEIVGDTDDQDCDGELDGSPFDTQDFGWDDPHSIFVGKTTDFYMVSTTAEFVDRVTATNTRAGLTMFWDAASITATQEAHPTPEVSTWWPFGTIGTAIPPIGSGFASIYNVDSLYAGFSVDYESGSTHKGFLIMRRGTSSGTGSLSFQTAQSGGSTEITTPYNDIDLRQDVDGYIWEWACGDDTAAVLAAKDSSASAGKLIRKGDTVLSGTGVNADTAVLFPGTTGSLSATGLCCASGSCKTFALTHEEPGGDTVGTSATITAGGAATQKYLAENSHNDWQAIVKSPQPGVLLVNADGTSHTVLTSKTVTDVAVAVDGTDFFVLASTTGTDLVFAYGAVGSLTEVTIPFTDGTSAWTAKHVGIYADADRIVLAATAADGSLLTSGTSGAVDADDHVGWVFLGR